MSTDPFQLPPIAPAAAPTITVTAAPIVVEPSAAPANNTFALGPTRRELFESFIIENPTANRADAARRFGVAEKTFKYSVQKLLRAGRIPDLRARHQGNEAREGEVTLADATAICNRSIETIRDRISDGALVAVRESRGKHFYAVADVERLRDQFASARAERERLAAERKERAAGNKNRPRPAFDGHTIVRASRPAHFDEPSTEILDPLDDGVRLDPSIKAPIKIRTVVDPIERPKKRWSPHGFSPRPTPPDPERDRSRAALLALFDPSKIVRCPSPVDRYAETVERNEAFRIEREESEAPRERRRRRERHESVLAERALDLTADEVIGPDRGPLSPEDLRTMAKAKARARLKEIAKAHARALLRLAGREHELDHQWRHVGETEDDADNEADDNENDTDNEPGASPANDSSDAL